MVKGKPHSDNTVDGFSNTIKETNCLKSLLIPNNLIGIGIRIENENEKENENENRP